MFAPLPSPAEMSGWDRAAIDLGLPELLLMENASREALHVLSAETGQMPGKRVLLFMGGGNNGGDAACLARHLHDGGARGACAAYPAFGGLPGRDGTACAAGRRCGVAFAPAAGWPEKYRNTPWDVYADASVCERGGRTSSWTGYSARAFPAASGRWSLGWWAGSTRWRNGPSFFLWISRPAFPD